MNINESVNDDDFVDSDEEFITDENDEEEENEEEDDEEEDENDEDEKYVEYVSKADKYHQTIHIVPPDERQTSNIMTRAEMVEAIGIRISQIEKGGPVFTDVSGYDDPAEMAKKELIDRRNPLKLRRIINQTPSDIYVEEWPVREMGIPLSKRERKTLPKDQLAKQIQSLKDFIS